MSEQEYEQLTLFPADSPANRSVLPGSAEAVMMTVTSGQRCSELSKNSGPLGCLEKMLLASSTWHSTRCYLTWKFKATKQGHLYFQLAVSMPRIDATDAPLLPTITKFDATCGDIAGKEYREGSRHAMKLIQAAKLWPTVTASDYRGRGPHSRQQGLPEAVKLWPTPTARDSKGANSMEHLTREGKRNHVDQLANAVVLWPTPTSRSGTGPSQTDTRQGGMDLQTAAAMFPTPTTGAGLCGGTGNFQQLASLAESGVISEEERRSMASGSGGQLNPAWVEAMMGFPPGWTKSEPDGQMEAGNTEFPESQQVSGTEYPG